MPRRKPTSKAFEGTIDVDIRDSVPDWAPFEPPRAPEGAPNVVYIVLDDVGPNPYVDLEREARAMLARE